MVSGFHGDALTEVEYKHALAFAASLQTSRLAWLVTTLLGSSSSTESIRSTVEKSPSIWGYLPRDAKNPIEREPHEYTRILTGNACVVLVGSPMYNALTHHLHALRLEANAKRFEFYRPSNSSDRGIRLIADDRNRTDVRKDDRTGVLEYFIVERMRVRETQVFVCAGTCTAATAAALDELMKWRSWNSEKYKGKDFGRLYSLHLQYAPDSTEGEQTAAREGDPKDRKTVIGFEGDYASECLPPTV